MPYRARPSGWSSDDPLGGAPGGGSCPRPRPEGVLMFPLLRTDPERAAWIDRFAADIGALAEDSRAELDAANRQNRFPREVYAELGRRGYLGPLVPREWGGLGGGAAE